jgi:hypothetical protein
MFSIPNPLKPFITVDSFNCNSILKATIRGTLPYGGYIDTDIEVELT